MRHFLLVILSCLIQYGYSWIENQNLPGNYFLFPPIAGPYRDYSNNKDLTIGSNVEVRWKTTFPSLTLWIWQPVTGRGWSLFENAERATHGRGPSIADTVADRGLVYYFRMSYGDKHGGNNTFDSHYFNVVEPGSPSAKGIPGSSTTAAHRAGSTVSSAAGIAIGAGVVLGAVCFLLAVAYSIYRRRRQRTREASIDPMHDMSNQTSVEELHTWERSHELAAAQQPAWELPDKKLAQELATEI